MSFAYGNFSNSAIGSNAVTGHCTHTHLDQSQCMHDFLKSHMDFLRCIHGDGQLIAVQL